MAAAQLATVVRRLHTLARERSDGELLELFALRRDEEAFAVLVRRHGPMVLGVCRRVLRQEQDAEDAFQASFLILARRAASVRRQEALGGWLYRVTLRVALGVKGRVRPGPGPGKPVPRRAGDDPAAEAVWRELRPVLDEEVQRLPEKYRAPVVLCHLEGKTHEAAAAQLGWPCGTVAGRLARARDLLRRRLTRRGVTLSAVALTAALSQGATAAVTEGLARETAEAAARFVAGAGSVHGAELARGVLHAMFLTRLKLAGVALLFLALVAVVGSSALGGGAGKLPVAKGKPELIGKPGQPPAAQKQPTAAAKDGLAIAVRPLKTAFALGETPAVEVTLRNVSKKALTLHHPPSWAYPSRRFVVEEVKTGRRQTCGLFFPNGPTLKDRKLGPGEALTSRQELPRLFVVPPPNEPLGDALRLAPGKYRVNATVRLQADPAGDGPYWSGELTSPWAEFEIALAEKLAGAPAKEPSADAEAIQGTWRVVDAETGGRVMNDEFLQMQTRWVVGKSAIELRDRAGSRGKWVYQLDPAKTPKTIDLTVVRGPGNVTVLPAIYQLTGDRLQVCICGTDHVRPTAFGTRSEKPGLVVYTLKREPPPQAVQPADKGEQPGKPSEYSGLSVRAPSGWSLSIQPDGSGNYAHGSLLSDSVPLPAGTFDFARVAEELKKRSRREGTVQTAYTVALHRRGVPVTVAVYTTDADYVAGLFAAARGRRTASAGGRIAALWSLNPPTPRSAGAWRPRPVAIRAPGPPFVVALAPDGKLAATGARPRLWDTATGKELAVLIPPQRVPLAGPRPALPPGAGFPLPLEHVPVRAVAFTPDGSLLATGGQDGTVKLWEVEKRTERATLKPPPGPASAQTIGPVLSLAFRPDGAVLAVAAGKAVCLWDIPGGKEPVVCSGHAAPVGSVAFSPDGKTLATASADRSVRLWDAATGKELHRFERHSDWVNAVAFSPDGKRLATTGRDRTVQLWDPERRELVCTLRGHTGEVRAAVFTPDGKYLLTAGNDRTVRIWDVAREELADVLGHPVEIRALALSADGGLLAVAGVDPVLKLWEPNRPEQAKR